MESESLLSNGLARQIKDPDVPLVKDILRVSEKDGYVFAIGRQINIAVGAWRSFQEFFGSLSVDPDERALNGDFFRTRDIYQSAFS